MKVLRAALAIFCAALSLPAFAQDWQGESRQDIYVAYGGSKAGGWLRFECPDPASGSPSAGKLSISLTVKSGVELSKKSVPAEIIFWISDGKSFLLPMTLATGSKTELRYEFDPASDDMAHDMLAAARMENVSGAYADDLLIMSIALEGSAAALRDVAECSQ